MKKITLLLTFFIILCSSSAHTLAKEAPSSFGFFIDDDYSVMVELPAATSYVNRSNVSINETIEQKTKDYKDVIAIMEATTSYVNTSNMSAITKQVQSFDEALQTKAVNNLAQLENNVIEREKTEIIETKIIGLELKRDMLTAKININEEDQEILQSFIDSLDSGFAIKLFLIFDYGSEIQKIFMQSQISDFLMYNKQMKNPTIDIDQLSQMSNLPQEEIVNGAYNG